MRAVSTLTAKFGRAVRSRRLELGISQEELAWRGGVNRSYITDIERGFRNPSLKTIAKLADALQTPLYVLLRDLEMLQEKPPDKNRGGEPRQGTHLP
jgi:transcriptional regulator with XRE-family HTH domain